MVSLGKICLGIFAARSLLCPLVIKRNWGKRKKGTAWGRWRELGPHAPLHFGRASLCSLWGTKGQRPAFMLLSSQNEQSQEFQLGPLLPRTSHAPWQAGRQELRVCLDSAGHSCPHPKLTRLYKHRAWNAVREVTGSEIHAAHRAGRWGQVQV